MSMASSEGGATTIPAAPLAKVRKLRLLVPKEHGAYFQLALPLITAVVMGRPTTSAVLFALSATASFLCHESLLVLIGERGPRARRENRARAARWLTVLGTLALVSGAAAWIMAPVDMSVVLLFPLGMAMAVGVLIVLRAERSTLGEILIGAALASAALPVASAAGVPPTGAWTAWVGWMIVGGGGTVAVRSIIQSNKKPIFRVARLIRVATLTIATIAIATQWPWAALAAAPTLALAIGWSAMPPHPRHLRRVGWTLAAATLAASAILIASVHHDEDVSPRITAMRTGFDFRSSRAK
jgi:hypothetical protein